MFNVNLVPDVAMVWPLRYCFTESSQKATVHNG